MDKQELKQTLLNEVGRASVKDLKPKQVRELERRAASAANRLLALDRFCDSEFAEWKKPGAQCRAKLAADKVEEHRKRFHALEKKRVKARRKRRDKVEFEEISGAISKALLAGMYGFEDLQAIFVSTAPLSWRVYCMIRLTLLIVQPTDRQWLDLVAQYAKRVEEFFGFLSDDGEEEDFVKDLATHGIMTFSKREIDYRAAGDDVTIDWSCMPPGMADRVAAGENFRFYQPLTVCTWVSTPKFEMFHDYPSLVFGNLRLFLQSDFIALSKLASDTAEQTGLLDNLVKFKDSALALRMGEIFGKILAFMTAEKFGYATNGLTHLLEFLKAKIPGYEAIASISDIISGFPTLMSRLVDFLTTGDVTALYSSYVHVLLRLNSRVADLNVMHNTHQERLAYVRKYLPQRVREGFSYEDIFIRGIIEEDVIAMGKELTAYMHRRNIPDSQYGMCGSIRTMLARINSSLTATRISSHIHIPSIGIGLTGLPAVGKTKSVLLLATAIGDALGLPRSESGGPDLHFRSLGTEFWDGYTGQTMLCYDEAGAVQPTLAKPETVTEILAGGTAIRAPLNYSAVEDKGRHVSRVVVMFATSNFDHFGAQGRAADEVAYRRRFPYVIALSGTWDEPVYQINEFSVKEKRLKPLGDPLVGLPALGKVLFPILRAHYDQNRHYTMGIRLNMEICVHQEVRAFCPLCDAVSKFRRNLPQALSNVQLRQVEEENNILPPEPPDAEMGEHGNPVGLCVWCYRQATYANDFSFPPIYEELHTWLSWHLVFVLPYPLAVLWLCTTILLRPWLDWWIARASPVAVLLMMLVTVACGPIVGVVFHYIWNSFDVHKRILELRTFGPNLSVREKVLNRMSLRYRYTHYLLVSSFFSRPIPPQLTGFLLLPVPWCQGIVDFGYSILETRRPWEVVLGVYAHVRSTRGFVSDGNYVLTERMQQSLLPMIAVVSAAIVTIVGMQFLRRPLAEPVSMGDPLTDEDKTAASAVNRALSVVSNTKIDIQDGMPSVRATAPSTFYPGVRTLIGAEGENDLLQLFISQVVSVSATGTGKGMRWSNYVFSAAHIIAPGGKYTGEPKPVDLPATTLVITTQKPYRTWTKTIKPHTALLDFLAVPMGCDANGNSKISTRTAFNYNFPNGEYFVLNESGLAHRMEKPELRSGVWWMDTVPGIEKGDSGSPVIHRIVSGTLVNYLFVGILIAKSTDGYRALVTPLIRPGVNRFPALNPITDMRPPGAVTLAPITGDTPLALALEEVVPLARVTSLRVQGTPTTRVEKSSMYDLFPEAHVFCAPTFEGRLVNGRWIDPWVKNGLQQVSCSTWSDEELVVSAMDVLYEEGMRVFGKDLEKLVPLSIEQAVNGVPGQVVSLNFDTSAGLGYPGLKEQYVNGDLGGLLPQEQVSKELLKRIETAKAGYSTARWYVGCLKDEVVKKSKNDVGDVRLFTVGHLIDQLMDRMIFGPLFELFKERRSIWPLAIGSNATSREWDEMASYLTEGGRVVMAGDYKKFDKKTYLLGGAVAVCVRWLEKSGYPPESLAVAHSLISSHSAYVLTLKGDAYWFDRGTPSGVYGTSQFNSLVEILNEIQAYWLGYSIHHKVDLSTAIKEAPKFFDSFRLKVYGDDHVKSVLPSVAEWYTGTLQVQAFEGLGQIYTSDTKDGPPRWGSITAATFLKRGFRFDPGIAQYVAPLEKMSIYKMLSWKDNLSIPESQWEPIVLEEAQKQAWFHGREFFLELQERLKTRLKTVLDYDSLSNEYVICQLERRQFVKFE
jgi:hypothetical protein